MEAAQKVQAEPGSAPNYENHRWFLGKMPQVECYATAETLKNP